MGRRNEGVVRGPVVSLRLLRRWWFRLWVRRAGGERHGLHHGDGWVSVHARGAGLRVGASGVRAVRAWLVVAGHAVRRKGVV